MGRVLHCVAAALLLAAWSGAASQATAHTQKAVKCANCGMTMSKTKTAKMTRAVKMSGTTYYCCASCGRHTAGKKCPNCSMTLSTKKTAAKARLVKVAGKSYYCCEGCGPHQAQVKCPKCQMTLSTKKTASMSQRVKVNGHTYYCCAACGPHPESGGPSIQ